MHEVQVMEQIPNSGWNGMEWKETRVGWISIGPNRLLFSSLTEGTISGSET